MTQLVQSYSYLHPSAVRESTAGCSLALETSGGATPAGEAANPHFFSGFLTAPTAASAPAATALLAVADMAAMADAQATADMKAAAGARATVGGGAAGDPARSETAR